MRYKILFLFLFFSFLSNYSFAQPKGFSGDPLKFISEMDNYFRDAKVEDETRKSLQDFKRIYEAGFYNDDQKKIIISLASKMADRKMKADQEYRDYMNTLIALSKSNKLDAFEKVTTALATLINKRNRDASNYLNFTSEFFNGQILNVSKSTKWYFLTDNYEMLFDSVPKIKTLGKINLISEARGDRSIIYETEGTYFPLKKIWRAKAGKVYWTRGGQDSLVVYANLNRYAVDCSKSDFSADSVLFFHTQLFTKPLVGRFEDRLTTNIKVSNATYPKFDSYQKNYDIKDFFKNVDYHGGFSMAGSKLYGIGSDDEKASILIYVNGIVALRTFSNAYILQKDEVVAYPTEVSIYLQKDSIYHPGVEFRFNATKRQMVLLRKDEGIGNSSFFDSYHQMTFEVERMQWDIDKPIIEMGMIKGQFQQESFFESKNFYKEEKFRKVAGISDTNPLSILKRLSIQQKSKTISIASYADAVRLKESEVLGLLRSLVEQGFIRLNENKGLLTITEKTFDFISNESGKLDYDVIRFGSLADSSLNAKLNLKTKDLDIIGIDQIFLSDSQSVNIRPLYGTVKVKANRDMVFGGKVHAGTLDFYGKNFEFSYNEFKIDMAKIDSLKIKVLSNEDINGRRNLLSLKTVLRDINGVLYIDDNDNKSGLKKYPQYPLFRANNESYVYYDYPYIQKGVYRRADFFFKIEPFTIDSLDDITSTSGLSFPGNFHSGGIFPDFDETLTFQPDTSLGFVSYAPAGGYPLYKGKGTYENQIRLSESGLYGKGTIKYIASTTKSDKFLFLLDSMNANINTFDLQKQSVNPLAASTESYMHWEPYEDSMFVKSKLTPTNLYLGKNLFKGTICYTPNSLRGNGWSSIKGADLFSRDFDFNPDDFTAEHSIARIYALDSTKFAIEAGDVKSKIDFIARQGDFVSNDPKSLIKFPANNYSTTLPEFTWFFDLQQMTFRKGTVPADSYSFISTHPLQDSLYFEATNALYDLKTTEIKIDGVKKLLIADAEIKPGDMHVEIFGDAIMRRLENAEIFANTTSRFHRLYDAKVDIYARRRYNANAYYDYKTKKDKVSQKINFMEIRVDSTNQSYGKGSITDTMNFLLNSKVRYKGDVYLHAADRFLTYDGFVKINTKSQIIQTQYFRYKGFVNPDTVALVFNDPRDENKNRVFTGVHLGITNYEGYGTFLSKKIEPNDVDVINVEGKLVYDEKMKLFKVGQDDKLFSTALKGKYYTFNDEKEQITAEGPIDLGVEFADKLKLSTAGIVTDNLGQNQVIVDVVALLDFVFLPEATAIMQKDIDLNGYDSDVDKKDRAAFEKGITELLAEEDATKLLNDIKLSGLYKQPTTLNKGFVISDVQMQWDQSKRSWRSTTNKIGIMNSYDKQINKTFKGYMEVVRKRSGNIVNLYFEMNPDVWYFYTFRQGQMEAISSNEDFNKILTEKTKGSSPFSISAMKRKLDFVRSF